MNSCFVLTRDGLMIAEWYSDHPGVLWVQAGDRVDLPTELFVRTETPMSLSSPPIIAHGRMLKEKYPEHYEAAKARLFVVVPLALACILALLWFAFRSMSAALLIFVNVPFAAIGGAVALALRGIPFSISAGVGFIALFGVSVLNGLVLVSFTRQLEQEGRMVLEAMRQAAELRLRPVLMTAAVAALGFIPMALSTAPGSEVQRPLATVVIGGLLSASALTLLLFPSLYVYSTKHVSRR